MAKSSKGDNRAEDMKWGETKKMVAYLLTPTAKDILGDAAVRMGTTKSEALEQIIRFAGPLAPNFTLPSPSPKRRSRGGSGSYLGEQGILPLGMN